MKILASYAIHFGWPVTEMGKTSHLEWWEQEKTEEILNGSQKRLAIPTNIQNPLRITDYQAGQVVNESVLSAFWFTMLRRGREEALGGCSSPPAQPIGTHCGALAPCVQGAQQPQVGVWGSRKSVEAWPWTKHLNRDGNGLRK